MSERARTNEIKLRTVKRISSWGSHESHDNNDDDDASSKQEKKNLIETKRQQKLADSLSPASEFLCVCVCFI